MGLAADDLVLGIESSCDETSVAVVSGDGSILVNLVSSQVREHAPFGGVVPEIAARAHIRILPRLLEQVRRELGGDFGRIRLVAATAGPGLVGALLVGLHAGEGLATGLGVPFYPINHLEGHLVSPFLRPDGGPRRSIPFPFLGVVVSGGHTAIYLVEEGFSLRRLARTRDDAAGEAFDKVGKKCGLGYPAGPHVDRLARSGDDSAFSLPRPRFGDGSLDFSYSGLKTAAIRHLEAMGAVGSPEAPGLPDLLASFQRAAVDCIVERVDEAIGQVSPVLVAVSGGVAANRGLQQGLGELGERRGLEVLFPRGILAADNAAMIALAGGLRYDRGVEPEPARARSRWDPAA